MKHHASPPSTPYDVIIMGGGIAGLTAALTIVDAKPQTRILILEGRNRRGGRIWSQKMKKNVYAELGAERIGKNDACLLGLCQRFGITLQKHDFDWEVREHSTRIHSHGRQYLTVRLAKKFERTLSVFLAQFSGPYDPRVLEYDAMSLEMLFFHIFGWDNDSFEFEDLLESNEFAEDVKSVSAANYIIYKLQGGGTDGMDYKLEGGNSSLVRSLVDYLKMQGVTITRNAKVEAVTTTTQIATVTTHETISYQGKQLICALPIKAMSKITWHPSLPKEKMHYINTIPYGRVLKRGTFTKHPLPPKLGICDDSLLHTLYNAGRGQISSKKKGLLGLYASGDRAMILSKRSDDMFIKKIRRVHPNIHCSAKHTYGYYRGNDPFTHGAFATYPAGTLVAGTKALAASIGNLHFCGEHTSLYHQGFMNGAAESGILAGEKSIRRLWGKKKLPTRRS